MAKAKTKKTSGKKASSARQQNSGRKKPRQSPNSLANLKKGKPFEPGDPRINRKGRPKTGGLVLREWINELAESTMAQLKRIADNKGGKHPAAKIAAAKLMIDMIDGNAHDRRHAMDLVFDRTIGKAERKDSLDVTTDGRPLEGGDTTVQVGVQVATVQEQAGELAKNPKARADARAFMRKYGAKS